MILSQRNNSIKRTFAVGWADWLGRTAESMMQFGKAVRRYCHVSVQYVQPLTVRPHLYMNAAAPLYYEKRKKREGGKTRYARNK